MVALNKSLNSRSLLTNILIAAIVARTLRREIFTSLPVVKPRLRLILRSVSTAMPNAHRQKRRMPFSLRGIIKV